MAEPSTPPRARCAPDDAAAPVCAMRLGQQSIAADAIVMYKEESLSDKYIFGSAQMRVLLVLILLFAAAMVADSFGSPVEAGSACNPNVQAC